MVRTLNLAYWTSSAAAVRICLVLLGVMLSPAAVAQQSLGIAAVVNDDMISLYDLNARLDAVIAFSGFPNTPETRGRAASQVLRNLIDERIKLQEAKRLKATATAAKISTEKATLERQNGMQPGQLDSFVKQRGIPQSTVDEQMEARALWNEIVAARYASRISISDAEVTEVIDKIKKNKGKPEDLVLEIFLPINQPDQVTDVTNLATRLHQQIQQGANFSAIAQNFSQSATAGVGGNLGWTLRGQLGADLNQIVQTLKPGQLSGPVRTKDGIYIVYLQATRLSPGLDGPPADPEKIKLFQLHLDLPSNPAGELAAQQMARVRALTGNLSGCADMAQLAKKIGSALSGELGTFELPKLSSQMQSLIKDLPVGRASAPLQIPGGIIDLMVCERIIPKVESLTPQQQRANIHNQLFNARLNLAAKRYLRDLRRAAFVDVRLGGR